MLQIFPFLPWLAVIVSAGLLVGMWATGELGPRGFILVGWMAIAAYCQFFGTSVAVTTGGLVLQTCLAVFLMIRWKLGAL
jgi:hypothetical protein